MAWHGRLFVKVLIAIVVLAIFATPGARRDAEAIGYRCEAPSSGGQGPCLAHFYGQNMLARFWINGIVISAVWSFDSQTTFYAYPVSGNQAYVIYMQHAIWTQGTWPDGTWTVGQSTFVEGWRAAVGCYQPCILGGIGTGPDYRAGDFDRQLAYWPNPAIISDGATKVKAGAGLWPSGGASGGSNHSRSECKILDPSGAINC